MILIFEGVDKSGKTTIAKAFAQKHRYYYFKHSNQQLTMQSMNRFKSVVEATFFIDFLSQINLDLIIDRGIPSEVVYSAVYHRPQNINDIFELDRQFSNINSVIIYCEKDHDKNTFNDECINYEDIEPLKQAYRTYLKSSSMPSLILNTTNEDLVTQLQIIYEFIKYL